LTSIVATAVSFFALGVQHMRRGDAAVLAAYDAQLDAIRAQVRNELGARARGDTSAPAGTAGQLEQQKADATLDSEAARATMVAQIKRELQDEMGLLPVHLLRDRRSSFVELYSYDNFGKTNYGTAGYLGRGHFITVKHAVVALGEDESKPNSRKIVSVRLVYNDQEIPAKVVDTGDAEVEVHSGDWAIIKSREVDLPALRVDTAFAYEFAEPLFRLGNDYSKGIILSTGYVGQRTANGLVTCLTDGHPGVSGGGVLNQDGDLVGIPIGRMQGDYRFSFILPMRAEMLRKVPGHEPTQGTLAANTQ
jgi:hypothetical protein